jgi:hypothetical protein
MGSRQPKPRLLVMWVLRRCATLAIQLVQKIGQSKYRVALLIIDKEALMGVTGNA